MRKKCTERQYSIRSENEIRGDLDVHFIINECDKTQTVNSK